MNVKKSENSLLVLGSHDQRRLSNPIQLLEHCMEVVEDPRPAAVHSRLLLSDERHLVLLPVGIALDVPLQALSCSKRQVIHLQSGTVLVRSKKKQH